MTKLEKLEELSLDILINCLQKDGELTPDELDRARIASSSRSTNAKIVATKRAEEAMRLDTIKTITEDPDERINYIKATMPMYLPK